MKLYEHIKRIVMLSFVIIYLISCFSAWSLPVYVGGVFLLPILFWFLPKMPKINLIVCSAMLAIGLAACVAARLNLREFLTAIMANSGIGAMFICTPLLSLPFYYERYQDELRSVAYRHMNKALPFLLLTIISSFILSSVLNMAAIPILYVLLIENARLYNVERLFLAALLQSFAATACFSPMWMQVPLTLTSFNLTLAQLIPYGFGLAVILCALSLLGLYLLLKKNKSTVKTAQRNESIAVNWKMLWKLLILAVALIAIIVILNAVFKIKIFAAIPIVSIPYAFFAALALKKLPQFGKGVREFYGGTMLRHSNEIVLMVSAGFMGSALVKLGAGDIVGALFPASVTSQPILVLLVIAGAYIMITAVGVNASVVTTVFAMTLLPSALGLSPLVLVLFLCGMHGISQMMSPFSGATMIVSGLHKMPLLTVGPGLNGIYGLTAAVALSLILGLVSA